MPEKKQPTIVDIATWEKVTKGRARTGWDSVVEKKWKYTGEHQEETMSAGKYGKCKVDVEEMIKIREMPALRIKVRPEKHLEIYGVLSEGIGMQTCLHGPMGVSRKR